MSFKHGYSSDSGAEDELGPMLRQNHTEMQAAPTAVSPAAREDTSKAASPDKDFDELFGENSSGSPQPSASPKPADAASPPLPNVAGPRSVAASVPSMALGPEGDGAGGSMIPPAGRNASGFLSAELPGNVWIEFYRTQLTRVTTLVFALALPLLFVTPIVGLIMVVPAGLALYWLRSGVRFQHGGDLSRCCNRDCSLVMLMLSSGATIALTVFVMALLAVAISDTDHFTYSDNLATGKGGGDAMFTPTPLTDQFFTPTPVTDRPRSPKAKKNRETVRHPLSHFPKNMHYTIHIIAIVMNAAACFAAVAQLHFTMKLRKAIDNAGHRVTQSPDHV